MKKLSIFGFYIFFGLVNIKLNAQIPNSRNDEIFNVLDVQPYSANYSIVTCRSYTGKTVQFQLPLNQHKITIDKSQVAFTPGTQVVADYKTGTASLKDNSVTKYKLLKSNFSERCCNITAIERSVDYQKCYISAKKDTANGLTYFIIITSLFDTYPPYHLQLGVPVYQKYYNGKRYAILKNPVAEGDGYIVLSYEFGFMTNETYSSIQKASNPNSDVGSGSTGSDNLDLPYELLGGSANSQNIPIGYISLNAPLNTEFTLKLINPIDHSVISSFDQTHLPSNIIPSTYDMEISGKTLIQIPVNNGQTTRIKAGSFSITTLSPWTLYDENKVKTIYSSVASKKVELPRGIYQLEINGMVHQIEIMDGEIFEYSDSASQAQTQKLTTNQGSPNPKVEQNRGESLTEEGYESVVAKFEILGNEHVDVKINGRNVLSFGDGGREVNLSHFLKPGKLNTVSFSFTKGSFSKIDLIGKFAGDEQGMSIYSFHPGENGTEGTFEFPFSGVRKK